MQPLLTEEELKKGLFFIDGVLYWVSDDPPQRGDLVLDTKDLSYGVHDGEFAGRIAVRHNWVVGGVFPEFVRKLIPSGEESCIPTEYLSGPASADYSFSYN